ncbi:staygreen family protein [Guptibacillus hwajinpoensis]|uniref:staygreen family protein n=1 Tax=Guptibacillus hwajinpoensis TaxID=208199 RepID=UPI00373560E2
MSSFNPQKFFVKIIPPATEIQPFEGRKYTLTHSDITAELFSSIGYVFDVEAINQTMRDEVIAEWKRDKNGLLYLAGKVQVDQKNKNKSASMIRFKVFIQEMNTALKGITYGDRSFFAAFPVLLNAPIYIYFDSTYPEYNQTLYYGTPGQYLNEINALPLHQIPKK